MPAPTLGSTDAKCRDRGVIIFKEGTVDTLELIHFPRIFCFTGTKEKAVTGVGRCAHTFSDGKQRSCTYPYSRHIETY